MTWSRSSNSSVFMRHAIDATETRPSGTGRNHRQGFIVMVSNGIARCQTKADGNREGNDADNENYVP